MTEHDRRATGQRIRDARIRMGWTQADLAATVGHPQPVLSRWENGARPITVDDLMLIARSLGVEPASLLPGNDTPPRRNPTLSAAAIVTQLRSCADMIEATYTETSTTIDNASSTSSATA